MNEVAIIGRYRGREGGMKTPMRGNHVGNIDRFQMLRTTKKKAAGVATIDE